METLRVKVAVKFVRYFVQCKKKEGRRKYTVIARVGRFVALIKSSNIKRHYENKHKSYADNFPTYVDLKL